MNSAVKKTYQKTTLGYPVPRPAAADPQNVWLPLFTVTGTIWLRGLMGQRTVIQAGGASTMQFRHSVGPTVLDAGTGAITGDTIGSLYWLTGDPTDPITVGVGGAAIVLGPVVATSTTYGNRGQMLVGGTIQVTMTAGAGTGSTQYVLWYEPVTPGAVVVAA